MDEFEVLEGVSVPVKTKPGGMEALGMVSATATLPDGTSVTYYTNLALDGSEIWATIAGSVYLLDLRDFIFATLALARQEARKSKEEDKG